jgi:alkanesulfonate monooxygenase SsuD/methylene tetrahydromethanopterin reductase-like flavin-dependent oxidoreductase (luciferase family)
VAEEIAMLDVMSGGRVRFGFGRGAARSEYEGFGIPMEESRDRFKEAIEIVQMALTTESFSYEGRFFSYSNIGIRPRPISHPERRFYAASMSPESADIMARLGLGVFIIAQKDWETAGIEMERYRQTARSAGVTPKYPVCVTSIAIAEDRQEARDQALIYTGNTFKAIDRHYGFVRGDVANVKGYEHHAKMAADYANFASSEEAFNAAMMHFLDLQPIGTPRDCLDKIEYIQRLINTDHFSFTFSDGGLPFSVAEKKMRLVSEKILPTLKNDPAFQPRELD